MRRQGALSLALAAFWLASSALAQPTVPSHVPLPGGIGDRGAFEDELVNRLNRARDLAASERLLKRVFENPDALGLDPEVLKKVAGNIAKDVIQHPERFNLPKEQGKLEELARQLQGNKPPTKQQRETLEKIAKGINPNDPDLKALFRDLDKHRDKLPKPDKEALEAMRRRIGNFDPPPKQQPGTGPGIRQPVVPPMGGNPGEPMKQPPGQPAQVPPMPPPDVRPPPPPRPPVTPPAERTDNRSWLSRQLSKLRGSTGLGGEFRGMFRGLFGERTGLGRFGRGLSSRTAHLRSKLLPSFGGIRMKGFMGGLSKVVPRDLKLSAPSPRDFSPRGLDGASAGRLGAGVLVVLLLAGVGVVAWLVLTGRRWVRGEGGRPWRLGPWPVTPASVQTRGDVVKAFEYLAMLLLGRRAVPANHLEIAGQLAGNDLTGQRRMAASELADLYEHARYAPPDEQLSPDEMASARRDLSLLAGSTAA